MSPTLSRRTFLATVLLVGGELVGRPLAAAAAKPPITVYRDPG